jgi:putative DNA primase/helicase
MHSTHDGNARRLPLDRREAKRFLDALHGSDSGNEQFAFQTFEDDKRRKNPELTRTWTAPFNSYAAEFDRLNQLGAGIFVTVNKTDGHGRKKDNATEVRALFVDLDGARVEPVQGWTLKPHIIVESSPGRYHAYWRHDGSIKIEDFGRLQRKLAVLFEGDRSVADASRVMRLPGTWHRKGEPFKTRVTSIDESAPAYSVTDFDLALFDVEDPVQDTGPGKPKRERKPREHLRAGEWINQEALHHIDLWAPLAFPGGDFKNGVFRVSPGALGRDCEEDLSMSPDGIRDFGQEWPHQPRVTYTAIKLCMAFFHETATGGVELAEFGEFGKPQGTLSYDGAAEMLAEALGHKWKTLLEEDARCRSDGSAFTAQQTGAGLQSATASSFKMRGVRWFWPNRFALGHIGLIGGLPDKGKGLLTTYTIAVATTGGEWPCGEGRAIQGNVILFTAEDGISDTVVPRLKAAGADLDRVHIIGMKRNADGTERMFNLAEDLPLLEQKLEKIGNVVLVVIDPMSSYLGVGKINNWSTTDVRGVLAPLKDLAEREAVCVIGVMHFNKKADVHNAMLRIADSLAYSAAARHVYCCVDDGEEIGRRLFIKAKNNLAPDTAALSYTVNTRCVGRDDDLKQDIWAPYLIFGSEHVEITATEAMQAEAAGAKPKNTAQKEAEAFLRERLAEGPVSQEEIVEEAKANLIAARTLHRAKKELGVTSCKEKGKPDGKWFWTLPEKEACQG